MGCIQSKGTSTPSNHYGQQWTYSPGSSHGQASAHSPTPSSQSDDHFQRDSFSELRPCPSRGITGPTLNNVGSVGENGCAIAAIACALGLSYDEVRPHAVENGFSPEIGMHYDQMKRTIKSLGGKAKIRYADDWSEVANFAIVSTKRPSGNYHAVTFERNEAGRFIYDCLEDGPIRRPDDLELAERQYLKIIRD